MDYELTTYFLAYALIITGLWAYTVRKENKLLDNELRELSKGYKEMACFTHTLHHGQRK